MHTASFASPSETLGYPLPLCEPDRLEALYKTGILDTPSDPEFDRITQLARDIFGADIAVVSFVDRDRQWFKSRQGVGMSETPRGEAFCTHAILSKDVLVVLDATKDARFANYSTVTGAPFIRFYAGAPVVSRSGHNLGTLCIIDSVPRSSFSPREQALLRRLAEMVSEATETHRTNRRLRSTAKDARDRYALVTRATLDGVWDWDLKKDEVYYSPRWQWILGLNEEPQIAAPGHWLDRVHPDDLPGVQAELRRHLDGEVSRFRSEHRLCHGDGSWRFVIVRGLAQRSTSGECTRIAGSLMDVTQDKTSDALTGLPNRLLLRDRLERRIQRATEAGDWNFAVLFVDVDRFKRINDRFGHMAGDKVITTVAQRLREGVLKTREGSQSMVARFAGDEFVILLQGVHSGNEALDVAKRLHAAVEVPISWEGEDIMSGISIGIVMASPECRTPEAFLQNADLAMYRAKAEGRNLSVLFAPTMQTEFLERFQLESDLRNALARNQFRVVYQPQIDLRTGRLLGCEALARWDHPQHGAISPARFIPLAEEIGFISEIDHWVLRAACQQLAEWRSTPGPGQKLRVSVNVSSDQFSLRQLPQRISAALEEYKLPASALCLEITETVLMKDIHAAIGIMRKLHEIGVGLHMDDFGSGYSSFKHLHELPFDTLKIDRSFIRNITTDTHAQKIVNAILNLAGNLHINVIAEGIEVVEQSEVLRHMGRIAGQGYYFSRPLEPAVFREQVLSPERTHSRAHWGMAPKLEVMPAAC